MRDELTVFRRLDHAGLMPGRNPTTPLRRKEGTMPAAGGSREQVAVVGPSWLVEHRGLTLEAKDRAIRHSGLPSSTQASIDHDSGWGNCRCRPQTMS